MLAQSFKAADELGISEPQKEALMKTLVLLETDRLEHQNFRDEWIGRDRGYTFDGKFNMAAYNVQTSCGTIMCICGTAEMVGKVSFGDNWTPAIDALFRPRIGVGGMTDPSAWRRITPTQAARALRSYLTTGDAKWPEAVSVPEASS